MAEFKKSLEENAKPRSGDQSNVANFNPQTSKGDASSSTAINNTTRSEGGASTGAATATAKTLIDQAKETAGQAYEAVTEKAAVKLDEQKATLTDGLSTVADSVRQVGDNLGSATTDSGLAKTAAEYTNTAARKIEDVAGYFETHDVRDMARDLENFARRNPAMFLGAAFGLGFLAARFFKSSAPRYDEVGAGRSLAAPANAPRGLKDESSSNDISDFSSQPL